MLFLPEGPWGAGGEGKAGGGVSDALMPEENLAAETSPFVLPSLHGTSGFSNVHLPHCTFVLLSA